MHFIYFLGRFHVLALHLPITLILVVAGLEWLTRGGRRPELKPALKLLWPATALSALLTVALGYMHFAEGGFTGAGARAHRALGTSVGVLCMIGWWTAAQSRKSLWLAKGTVAALLVVLVTVTGHFGGNLTHGSDYLVQYAPNVVRKMLGLEPARAPVTSVATADPYLDVVRPIFAERCLDCHNADKQRGGLNLSDYKDALKGGEDGPVIVKGHPDESNMIHRVSLTPGSDDFMPKDGKTPLTADQIAILRWWIRAGAPTHVTVAQLQPPAEIEKLLDAQLHLGSAGPAGSVVASTLGLSAGVAGGAPEIALGAASTQANPKLVDGLTKAGFEARQVSMLDPHLIVSPTVPGEALTASQLQALATAGAQVHQLDLAAADLDDEALSLVAQLTRLQDLKLDRNRVTDKGVQALSPLTDLRILGLYGNAGITDASVDTLSKMKSLKKVYLWQTGLTANGVAKLRQTRPDLMVDFGDMAAAPNGTPKKEEPPTAAE